MRSAVIESLVKKLFNAYINESETLRGVYHFSTICKDIGGVKTRITGLYPIGFSEDEAIRLKYLRGKMKRVGAVATIFPELEIKEGILADCIRLFNLNSPSDPYVFRLYSSSLLRKRLFRDGAISIYSSKEELESAVLEVICAIEEYFIRPQCMIYNMNVDLLEYIDKNHSFFTYPFLSKLIIYLRHTKSRDENELYSLAEKRFSDYKYRTQIIRLALTESIHRVICD